MKKILKNRPASIIIKEKADPFFVFLNSPRNFEYLSISIVDGTLRMIEVENSSNKYADA